jgi:hypothetical protein
VASPEDSVVISIAHGVINGDGDWAMDVAYRLSVCQVDWDRVVHIADRRGLVPSILSGLAYVKTLGVDIPRSILNHLHEGRPTLGEYLKYLSDTLGQKYWVDTLKRENLPYRLRKKVGNALLSRLRKRVDQMANALLPRDRYQYWGGVWNSAGIEVSDEHESRNTAGEKVLRQLRALRAMRR